jgi:hypothetical protein
MFYFKILIFLVIYLKKASLRGTKQSPNYTGQAMQVRSAYVEIASCLAMTGGFIIYVEINQPNNTNQISLSTLRFFNSLLITFKAFFFLASFAFFILAASARNNAASVLLRS